MIFPDNIEKENEPGDTKQTKENLKHFTTDVIKMFQQTEPFWRWTCQPLNWKAKVYGLTKVNMVHSQQDTFTFRVQL